MNRLFAISLAAAALVLAGCPIYPDEGNGGSQACTEGGGRTCTNAPTDCSRTGCASGYVCTLSGGAALCMPVPATSTRDAGGGGTPDAWVSVPIDGSAGPRSDANGVGDGSLPIVDATQGDTDTGARDASRDAATEAAFAGCRRDQDCAASGTGARCLSGTCTAQANLCSDQTQCVAGSQCVDGACVPSCSADVPCPKGFGCDQTKGVCTINPTPCSTTESCQSGLVCSQEHCVAPCGDGGSCSLGMVCVEGGCVPDERPRFVCEVEGAMGTGTPGGCALGSICLHHNCYISCDTDAGDSCKGADQFNVCKAVETATGRYAVCGSSTNLGGSCDPTQDRSCAAGLVCIDGFCR